MATTQKKSDDTGAALPPTRILNADISLWWMGVVTDNILDILNAHGIIHYQTVGRKHDKIKEGDLIIVEGYELKGLYEVYENAKAARKDWHSHVGIVRHDHLDSRGYTRLLSALSTGKLSDLSSFSYMPIAIQGYWAKFVETTIRDKIVYNARGVAVDSGEPERVIASLDMILAWINSPEAKPVARKMKRDLLETDLERVLHVAPATADLFASNSWLPTESAVAVTIKRLDKDGFDYEKGAEDLPQKVKQLHASATPSAGPAANRLDDDDDSEDEGAKGKKKGKGRATRKSKKETKPTKPKSSSSKAGAENNNKNQRKRKAEQIESSDEESGESDSEIEFVEKKKKKRRIDDSDDE